LDNLSFSTYYWQPVLIKAFVILFNSKTTRKIKKENTKNKEPN
jgi:hypothetical protein